MRDETARWFAEDESLRLNSMTVHEESDAEFTGILDRHGNRLYRVKEKIKMGFGP